MDFFDGWKTLNARFDQGDLTAQTQLVGYKIFAIFNERMFPDSLPISDRELMSRTNIKSTRTIVEARRALKNAGLIDFDSRQGKGTVYRLAMKQLVNSKETVSKQLVNSSETVDANSIIRVREDVKTLDIKTKKEEETRAHETEMDVHDLWEYETGYALTGSVAYELEQLEKTYGREAFHKALIKAVQSNTYPKLRFSYFKAVLTKKGGEKVETADTYTNITRTGNEPWLNY